MNSDPSRRDFNLQFFSDPMNGGLSSNLVDAVEESSEDNQGGDDSGPDETDQQSDDDDDDNTESDTDESGETDDSDVDDVPSGEQTDDTPEDSGGDDIPDKYKNEDGSLKDSEEVIEMHRNLESKLGEKSQENQQVREELAELRGMIEASQTEPDQDGDGEQPSEDDIVDQVLQGVEEEDAPDPSVDPEGYREHILNQVPDIVEQQVEERLAPIEEEVAQEKGNELLDEYSQQNEDFEKVRDEVEELANETEVGGEKVYHLALRSAQSKDEAFEILDQMTEIAKSRANLNGSSGESDEDDTGDTEPSDSNTVNEEQKATSTNGQSSTSRTSPSSSDEQGEKYEENLSQSLMGGSTP